MQLYTMHVYYETQILKVQYIACKLRAATCTVCYGLTQMQHAAGSEACTTMNPIH